MERAADPERGGHRAPGRRLRRRRHSGVLDFLLGRPLSTAQALHERIGIVAGVALLGLDALSSAAYGPEAALTVLRPLGTQGVWLLLPVVACIIGLLMMVASSYMQTIAAYPHGGGAYTVARENLGQGAGRLAASALMLDYVLNVAVGISAGVGALVSVFPGLHAYTLALTLGLLALLTLINLRGVREAGAVFVLPTWLFIAALVTTLGVGALQMLTHGGHPLVEVPPPSLPAPTSAATVWLVLRAFASGCTAMTGVEAISNGVPLFRDPSIRRARTTLALIVGTLVLLLAGVAVLCRAYGVGATVPGSSSYQSVLSQLIGAVMGRGAFYYGAMATILAVLSLSANTSFADFPRVCRLLAQDRNLPVPFAHRGRRLVFSYGILTLAVLAAVLLIVCQGITDRLIPLFAMGALLAFTLSQLGMVVHWNRHRAQVGWQWRRAVNGVGATLTALTLLIVGVSKFAEGGWAALLLIPLGVLLFSRFHAAYARMARATGLQRPIRLPATSSFIVVVPVDRWSHASEAALCFALELSQDVHAVHVCTGEDAEAELSAAWRNYVEGPMAAAGREPPRLVHVPSPYRGVVWPLLDHVDSLLEQAPHRTVVVVLPELLERRWFLSALYGHRSEVLRSALLMSDERRLVVTSVPWYLPSADRPEPHSAWWGASPGDEAPSH
ncbi:APC family permease [Myxococcaceae bacterium JPH2]|nr:APC family permease [Myxococcaceae bacterium JPH2]